VTTQQTEVVAPLASPRLPSRVIWLLSGAWARSRGAWAASRQTHTRHPRAPTSPAWPAPAECGTEYSPHFDDRPVHYPPRAPRLPQEWVAFGDLYVDSGVLRSGDEAWLPLRVTLAVSSEASTDPAGNRCHRSRTRTPMPGRPSGCCCGSPWRSCRELDADAQGSFIRRTPEERSAERVIEHVYTDCLCHGCRCEVGVPLDADLVPPYNAGRP